MLAKYERRSFDDGLKVWIEKYRALHNIPHWHFENELIGCLAGTASVMLDGVFYSLNAGMCFYCHGESAHCIVGSPDSLLLVAQVEPSVVPGLAERRLARPMFPDLYRVRARMEEIYREYQEKGPFYADKVNAMMALLLVDVFRSEPMSTTEYKEANTLTRYKQLLAEIDRRFDELTFPDAADYMNMSEAYFSRYFKRMSGMTFSRYLNVVRVGKAIDFLGEAPGQSVAELMTRCGFNTLRNFNRVFKSVTGYSPSQLPQNYILHIRSLSTETGFFDPTLDSSEISP